MEQPILQVEHLTKFFSVGPHAEVHAVDDVNFTLRRGRTFGLVGESGCGKSSCARTIIRIYEPSQGKIIFNGQDIAHLKPRQMQPVRRNMQMIFQDPYSSLNPRMTVANIIGEGLLAHKYCKKANERMHEEILQTMEDCGLAPYFLHRYPHQFSGGQRQRIGIARSLAVHPKFVVCDEAVSALDVSIQSQIINLLQDLKEQQHLTYLFITHDLSVVKYISDRIGVMYLGNLVELADSQEIFDHPMHPYTEALLESIPTTEEKRDLAVLEGDIPSPVNPPKGCKFHTRCKYCTEICTHVVPDWEEVTPNHFVACHHKLHTNE